LQVDYVFPESATITPACRDLIQKILVADPAKRLTIAQIFQHPWVQQVGGYGGWAGGVGGRSSRMDVFQVWRAECCY